jgi:hypothetical protein
VSGSAGGLVASDFPFTASHSLLHVSRALIEGCPASEAIGILWYDLYVDTGVRYGSTGTKPLGPHSSADYASFDGSLLSQCVCV